MFDEPVITPPAVAFTSKMLSQWIARHVEVLLHVVELDTTLPTALLSRPYATAAALPTALLGLLYLLFIPTTIVVKSPVLLVFWPGL